jgi:phosphoribosylanthranilate isomerase
LFKIKICGVSTLSDAKALDKLGVDMIGLIIDPISPRYVKPEMIDIVKREIRTPVVAVKVNGNIKQIVNEAKKADYIQIHRVLNEEELLELYKIYNKYNTILYVPSDLKYKKYFERVLELEYNILIDVPVKGQILNVDILSKFLNGIKNFERIGIAGKINLNNIKNFMKLKVGWFDISSSVEEYPGKKDILKVKQLIEVIKNGT